MWSLSCAPPIRKSCWTPSCRAASASTSTASQTRTFWPACATCASRRTSHMTRKRWRSWPSTRAAACAMRFPLWSSSPSLAGAPCAWQTPARFWARCPRPFSPSSPAASRRATWWSSLAWCARRWTRATTLWSLRATWWGTCATFTPPLSRVPSPSCWTARPRRRRRLRRRRPTLRTPTAWRAS